MYFYSFRRGISSNLQHNNISGEAGPTLCGRRGWNSPKGAIVCRHRTFMRVREKNLGVGFPPLIRTGPGPTGDTSGKLTQMGDSGKKF